MKYIIEAEDQEIKQYIKNQLKKCESMLELIKLSCQKVDVEKPLELLKDLDNTRKTLFELDQMYDKIMSYVVGMTEMSLMKYKPAHPINEEIKNDKNNAIGE